MEAFASITTLAVFVTLLTQYFKEYIIQSKDVKVFKKVPLTLIVAFVLSMALSFIGQELSLGIYAESKLLHTIANGVLVFLTAVGTYGVGITDKVSEAINSLLPKS